MLPPLSPPTPACILLHTEIIVEFVAIRMHTAQHSITVLLLMHEVLVLKKMFALSKMFPISAILHFFERVWVTLKMF